MSLGVANRLHPVSVAGAKMAIKWVSFLPVLTEERHTYKRASAWIDLCSVVHQGLLIATEHGTNGVAAKAKKHKTRTSRKINHQTWEATTLSKAVEGTTRLFSTKDPEDGTVRSEI